MQMKRIVFGIITILTLIALPVTAKGAERGNIVFETTTHDFGTINEKDGAVTCEFNFVNQGDGNIFITDAKAQCGCTRPSFPEAPVKPGKKGKIKVTYNPAGRPGPFTKTVTVYLQNCKKSRVTLKIKGKVE